MIDKYNILFIELSKLLLNNYICDLTTSKPTNTCPINMLLIPTLEALQKGQGELDAHQLRTIQANFETEIANTNDAIIAAVSPSHADFLKSASEIEFLSVEIAEILKAVNTWSDILNRESVCNITF